MKRLSKSLRSKLLAHLREIQPCVRKATKVAKANRANTENELAVRAAYRVLRKAEKEVAEATLAICHVEAVEDRYLSDNNPADEALKEQLAQARTACSTAEQSVWLERTRFEDTNPTGGWRFHKRLCELADSIEAVLACFEETE